MPSTPLLPKHWPGLGLLVLALTAFSLVFATGSAGAAGQHERLVVRGQSIAVDGPCSAFACPVALTHGRFRSSPLGIGVYTGSLKRKVASSFPNGEGGICAPLRGRIELVTKPAGRIGLSVSGDSCQDGPGFSGLARFTVTYGTGAYAGATGSGVASLTEDAAKHHRMTLIGRIDH